MNLKTTATVVALMVPTTTLASGTLEECERFANTYVEPVTDARDQGVDVQTVGETLMQMGFSFERAQNLINMVYGVHAETDKEDVIADFMNWCLGTTT